MFDSHASFRLPLAILVLALFMGTACRQSTESSPPAPVSVYVVNEEDDSVSIIDGVTNNVVATVAVGKYPHYVALDPAGSLAYVTNGDSGTVSVIDTARRQVVREIKDVRGDPQQIVVHPDGKLGYVPCYDTSKVLVLDLASGKVAASIPAGESPQSVALTRDGGRLYVVSLHEADAVVVDTESNRTIATFVVGEGASGVAVSPDGERIYLGGHGMGMWMGKGEQNRDLRVLSATTFQQVSLIRCGVMPIAVKLSADGRQAFVASHGSGELHIVDTTTGKASAVRVGNDCRDIAATGDGKRAYVTNRGENTVSVVEVASRKVIATVRVGKAPLGIAVKEGR